MKDLTSTPHPQTNGAAFSEEALAKVRADFPILQQQVHGKALVYLDNAATAQKPSAVIDAMADFYRHQNANIHRGVHFLSMQATRSYDDARARVARPASPTCARSGASTRRCRRPSRAGTTARCAA